MPTPRFDTYYRYDDLSSLLHAYADEYPNLIQIESIGKSYEGRDVWLLTLTNKKTGVAREKPALWVDGNIHATEVSPSMACLYLLHTLTNCYGDNEDITRCLDTRTLYLCPRVNPDGAEWALADQPKIIRSSTRPYPYDENALSGLVREDIDGDGRMLIMRFCDENGPWKVSEADSRLLVRREPAETGGTYYRVLPEGTLENYDGTTLKMKPVKEGLDLNRNFPSEWRQEGKQKGAGLYPTSEPEVRSVVDFVANHPNITGGISFHTHGGVLLRPSSHQPDEAMPAEDLWTFEKIGQKGTELTGYPNVSVYHDFRYHPKEVMTGAFDDWLFDHLGVFGWTVEIWSPQVEAGIHGRKFIEWYREHPVEDDLKLLKWNDEVLEGQGYIDWYSFEHPQLGEVELGGWNMLYAFRNPPPHLLEKELARFPEWTIWHLLISPKLELFSATSEPLGNDHYRIKFSVHNTGWLPTYVTKKALENSVVRGVVAEIELPESASLISGKVREERGQLEGRAYKPSVPHPFFSADETNERLGLEWIVHAPNGGEVKLTARHERAGVVRISVKTK